MFNNLNFSYNIVFCFYFNKRTKLTLIIIIVIVFNVKIIILKNDMCVLYLYNVYNILK